MRIGLTQRVFEHNNQSYDATDQAWYTYFSGHEIIPIKNQLKQNMLSTANSLDCLVITGGNSPRERIDTELGLLQIMMHQAKPIIGICHGAFLMTELFRGEVINCEEGHYNTKHNVTMDGQTVEVNSHHKLQIKTPPPVSTVLAVDDDGYCESWMYGSLGAVVWHPERMDNPKIPNGIKNLMALSL